MKAERLRLVPQSVVANQAIPLIEAVWNQYFRVSDGLSASRQEIGGFPNRLCCELKDGNLICREALSAVVRPPQLQF
jgi:hypothetical protein